MNRTTRVFALAGAGALAAAALVRVATPHAFAQAPAPAAPPPPAAPAAPTADLTAVAEDAYIYGYPLVLMDATKRTMTAASEPGPRGAPVNRFQHIGSPPDPAVRAVVRPNVDTLYSTAWLDLSHEPLVLHVPAIQGRFYMLQMLDAWTNDFADPGSRTARPTAHDFVIVGPGWHGTLPAGLERLDSPTNMGWIIGRTQVNGPGDEPAARALQAQYTLQPLSAWQRHEPAPRSEPTRAEPLEGDTPPRQVAQMDGPAFFRKLAELMRDNPAPSRDAPALARFAALGLRPGQPFEPTPQVAAALANTPARAVGRLRAYTLRVGTTRNGWTTLPPDVGEYGTDYLTRATIALVGLGANRREDALYPVAYFDGNAQRLTGAKQYTLHFARGQTPPVDAFWSITMYDPEGYFVPNALGRFALRDRDPLHYNADGSLDLYVQREDPGAELRSNWLPAPAGAFNLMMRLYQPKAAALNGTWLPPPLQRRAPAAPAPHPPA